MLWVSLFLYQENILTVCGFVCFLLAFFFMVMKFKSIKRKRVLILLEIGVGVSLFFEAMSYLYQGASSTKAYWVVRIATFLVYMLTLINTCVLNEYVTYLFMETGRFEKLPKRLLAGFVIPSVGMTFVVINLFTGIYYRISAANLYVRGPLTLLSMAFAIVPMLIMLSFVVQHRSKISKGLVFSISLFVIAPIIGSYIQFFVYDKPFISLCNFISAILLFWITLIHQNKELSNAAFSDMGTGLPNADGYLYEIDRIKHYQDITKYTAFYFDIVRMSHINNKYGKKMGDEIILLYAAELKKHVEKDEILGRLGGNFFVALIKKENEQEFLNYLQNVKVHIFFEGRKETVDISAVSGLYRIDNKNLAPGQILSYTSSAIAFAKSIVHKPYVYMDKELQAEFDKTRRIEAAARVGIRNEEFEIYYQPKVNATDNELFGAEALVRWRKDGGLVPPMEFIPILERNRGICDLDFYVLEHVCQDIKGWIEKGYEPVPVSVNFSRKNLGNPILAEAIYKVVEKYDIPKNLIQIEMTETLDEYPMSYLIGVVKAIQRYGMTVAIDDFGTGSSSINLLKLVKFDVLKIDKAFIDYADETEMLILQDIIQMASHIKIDVIAEGVEDKEHLKELVNMGCYQIQGYVYDKPLEKQQYEIILKKKKYS